mmetsp:Transcript_14290/g.21552  ORF Transcript_14290/g.21552 Transcript_14290/m.21552 type:complete len:131 (-) Transcript_14290:447-839(-)
MKKLMTLMILLFLYGVATLKINLLLQILFVKSLQIAAQKNNGNPSLILLVVKIFDIKKKRAIFIMEDQGMPMVMQSRDDMMEELMEGLMDEGMTQEEAKEFIQATQAAQSGEPSANDDMPGFMQPGADEL